MNTERPNPPQFWRTVVLLLRNARKRASGRRTRQQQLLGSRSGGKTTDWGALGFAFSILAMAFLNGAAAFMVSLAVDSGQRMEAEKNGKIVVSRSFLQNAKSAEALSHVVSQTPDQLLSTHDFEIEAKDLGEKYGGAPREIEEKLRNAMRSNGARSFITLGQATPGIRALANTGRFPAMLGSVFLLWWGVMLTFQGEGLELDLQRRRHPMWEWLFAHPIPAGAIFFAEMLSPIAANPVYFTAPLFVGFLYGFVYGPNLGMLAALLIGVPVAVAAACLGKALEIGVILRFSPRTRGAMIGLMGWMGYASMMLFFLGIFVVPRIVNAAGTILYLFTAFPWPWLRWFLGGSPDGTFSFLMGAFACCVVVSATLVGSVWFSVWGAQKGLSGNFAAVDLSPSRRKKAQTQFGREPLYRKEFLWFVRDRSAIVQTILIPLTVAGVQMFNFRGVLRYAEGAWNYLCGAAILFGTYFLWVLGPKSLASEGSALWIAMTWPRGLESLLKAKAWLWSMISSGIVAVVLCYAIFLFRANTLNIALVGVGWFFFGRSMAEKSVTLVTVTSESGEPQKVPAGRRWATQLGMLTFSIGVLTQQWHIAVMGIVYSYLTAAAMWQNFRARLPYLYDPWSEKLPPPPTLMHAMVAISILVEGGAVITGTAAAIAGKENIAIVQAIGYGVAAVAVSVGVWNFLNDRGVPLRDVLRWVPTPVDAPPSALPGDRAATVRLLLSIVTGAIGGLALGLVARGYLAVLQHIPSSAELIRKSQEVMSQIPNLKISYAVMAVGFAPFAEEYLFRGLLFRALDREWGGWRAVVGSAAFFAIYHPPLSWLPVSLLGAANALLFKKTGRLAPAVILHMVYNAVVLT